MKVEELRAIVSSLKELLVEGDAKVDNLRGVDEFVDLLTSRDGQSVDELIAELQAVAALEQVNEVAVRRHIIALTSAQLDRSEFEKALSALRSDKSVGTAEADLIFKQYHGRTEWRSIYGEKPRWRKRTDAIRAIETSFIERVTQQQKHDQVIKATPW